MEWVCAAFFDPAMQWVPLPRIDIALLETAQTLGIYISAIIDVLYAKQAKPAKVLYSVIYALAAKPRVAFLA